MPKKYQLYAVGNALVDIVVQVSEAFLQEHSIAKGSMTLTEYEKQAQLLASLPKEGRSLQSGGSAANTAVAFAQLGGSCFYACRVGDDELGHFYLQDLQKAGVHSAAKQSLRAQGRTGTCLVMVTPDAERSMHTHLGVTSQFSEEQLHPEALSASEWLYMEGYLLTSQPGLAALQKAKTMAQAQGTKIALSLSDPLVIQNFRDRFLSLLEGGVDLLFCNHEEARLLTGTEDVAHMCEMLQPLAARYAVTIGKRGAFLYDGADFYHIPASSTQVIDTNGAGDMFAGTFLYALTQGHSFEAAGALGCRRAAKIVSQLGPRLGKEQISNLP